MKSIGLFFVIFLAQLVCYAQAKYMPGYLVLNNYEKIECEILFNKYNDWAYYPKNIHYKINAMSESTVLSADSLRELFIENGPHYKKYLVKIDRSSSMVDKISTTQDPIFNEEEIMLKTLISGKASFYMYEIKNFVRYFIKMDTFPIEQLIYKKYFKPIGRQQNNGSFNDYDPSVVYENTTFRQQLSNYLDCKDIKKSVFEYIYYYEDEIAKLIRKYNKCINKVN